MNNELPKITDIIAKYAQSVGDNFTIPYKHLNQAFKEYGILVRDTTIDLITAKTDTFLDISEFKKDKRLHI